MTKKPPRKVRPAPKAKPNSQRAKGATQSKSPGSKLDRIVSALRAAKGATIPALMQLTGWQAHSLRGALAGALKKRRGLLITSSKVGDERVYKLEVRK